MLQIIGDSSDKDHEGADLPSVPLVVLVALSVNVATENTSFGVCFFILPWQKGPTCT